MPWHNDSDPTGHLGNVRSIERHRKMDTHVSLGLGASQLNAKTALNAELSNQEPKNTDSPIQAPLRAALT